MRDVPPTSPESSMRLSPNMQELLLDCAEHTRMYVDRTSKWERSAQALRRRGLVTVGFADSRLNQYEVMLTEAGKGEAINLLGQVRDA